jgi:non-structural maintenance of chromosomes element 1
MPVGEGAVKDGQDEGRRRVRRKDTPEGSNEEDDIDDGEPSQPLQPTQTQTQMKKKMGRLNAAGMDVDDDEEDDYAPRRRSGRQ